MSGAGLNIQGFRFRDVGSGLQRLGFRVCFFSLLLYIGEALAFCAFV